MITHNFKLSHRKFIVNPVIRALIVNDFVIWTGINLISPLLPLFIAFQVEGDPVQIVALSVAIFMVTQAIVELPIGIIIDKLKGDHDELWFRVWGTVIASLVLIAFPFSTLPWHVYVLQAISALGRGMATPSFISLFSKHVDKKIETTEWSLEDTLIYLGMAAAAATAGLIVEELGYATLFWIAGGLNFVGAFIPLLAFGKYNNKSKKKK